MRIYILLLSVLLMLTACYEKDPKSIKTSLVLKDNFSQESNIFTQGGSIEFYLTATNTTNNVVTLNFNSSQQYDFYILNNSSYEIWRWSDDKLFAAALSGISFQAGETKIFSVVWDQKLSTGKNIQIGNYIAKGSLLNQSELSNYNFKIQ